MSEFARFKTFGFGEALHAHYITHEFARHTHDGYAIGVVMRGVESFRLGQTLHHAPAGSVIVVHPGEVHTGFAPVEEGWEYRMFYPSVEWLRAATGQANSLPCVTRAVLDDPEVAVRLERAHRALMGQGLTLGAEALLAEALGLLFARYKRGALSLERSPGREPVVRVVRFLRQDPARSVSLEQLAQLSGLSRFHLVRAFREHTGLPPHLYQLQLRVELSKALLRGDQPLAQVALEAGFADQAHFTKAFKRIVGVTPGAYRAAI